MYMYIDIYNRYTVNIFDHLGNIRRSRLSVSNSLPLKATGQRFTVVCFSSENKHWTYYGSTRTSLYLDMIVETLTSMFCNLKL